jgi:hypothetical protein
MNQRINQMCAERFAALSQRYNAEHEEYFRKQWARRLVYYALRLEIISKTCYCEECGKVRTPKALTAHHINYDAPLNIKWLCRSCHDKIDGIIRECDAPEVQG